MAWRLNAAATAGAPVGIGIYPGIEMVSIVATEGLPETNPNSCRKYSEPVNFFKPTFYISASLGEWPAELVQDLIAGDKRVFGPMQETLSEATNSSLSTDHNYNDNTELVKELIRVLIEHIGIFCVSFAATNRGQPHPDRLG